NISAFRRLECDAHARLGHGGVKVAYSWMLHHTSAWLCKSFSASEEDLPNCVSQEAESPNQAQIFLQGTYSPPNRLGDYRRPLPWVARVVWGKGRGYVAWAPPRAGRGSGGSPPAGDLNLNAANGVLQHQTLMVEIFFVKWTIVKLLRLSRACASIDGAPGFKS